MSKKTKTKTDAIDWAKPALTQGVANTQDAYESAKPITERLTTGIGNVFDTFANRVQSGSPTLNAAQNGVAATASGGYLGSNPGQATYLRLQGYSNPALASVQGLLGGHAPQGDYTARTNAANDQLGAVGTGGFVGQGDGMEAIRGLLSRGGSPTADYYKKTLAGEYLNGNPYADFLTDDVADGVNGQFSLAGRYGSGAHTGVLARETGKIKAGLYNAERDRMNSVASMADSYDLNDRASVLSAANAYGDNTRSDRAQQLQALGLLSQNSAQDADRSLSAAGARDQAGLASFNSRLSAAGLLGDMSNADARTQFGAAQAADGAYGDERQRMLQASSLAPGLSQADYAGLGPLLALAQQYQQTPFSGVSAYNQNVSNLSSPYSTTTSKQSGLGNALGTIIQTGNAAAQAYMGGAGMGGGSGLGGFTQGWSSSIPSIAQQTGLLSQDPWAGLPTYQLPSYRGGY